MSIKCFDTADIIELSEASLADAESRLKAIPAELCAPFNAEARSLDQELLHVYRTAVLCIKKEDDPAEIAKWWQAMVQICDAFAGKLHGLCESHPDCGAGIFYDRVLDLRNKCQRLAEMHS